MHRTQFNKVILKQIQTFTLFLWNFNKWSNKSALRQLAQSPGHWVTVQGCQCVKVLISYPKHTMYGGLVQCFSNSLRQVQVGQLYIIIIWFETGTKSKTGILYAMRSMCISVWGLPEKVKHGTNVMQNIFQSCTELSEWHCDGHTWHFQINDCYILCQCISCFIK